MIKILAALFAALYSILPGSPVQAAFKGTGMDAELLAYLNWFVPFDAARDITFAWLNCILAYYVFTGARKLISDLVIGKLVS